MSGGRLVVLDRLGRDVKRYPLPSGLATLGSDHGCHIRLMLATVFPHHATVVVHANQTVIRNVSEGATLVNGKQVSVAALEHGDTITIGERSLRWEYDDPNMKRPSASQVLAARRARLPRGPRRASAAPALARDAALSLALELRHRASMPGGTGGKQVAIVQPQRRDNNEVTETNNRATPKSPRGRRSNIEAVQRQTPDIINTNLDTSRRKSVKSTPKTLNVNLQRQSHLDNSLSDSSKRRYTPKSTPRNTHTKASLWIESRKSAPRRAPARRSLATKIQEPDTIDHTKQAAIMLMTGHTPKIRVPSPKKGSAKKSPTFLIKKPSPVRKTPKTSKKTKSPRSSNTPSIRVSNSSPLLGRSGRHSSITVVDTSHHKSGTPVNRRSAVTPNSAVSDKSAGSRRSSKPSSGNQSVTILEITDSDTQSSARASSSSRRSSRLALASPTPRKSALKDPTAKKNPRKTESIKFDLSNLENYNQSEDILTVNNTTRRSNSDKSYETDLTLHFSDTSIKSPSPRKSIHSRSSKILEKSLGRTVTESSNVDQSTFTPKSPQARKSMRGSILVRKALENSANDLSAISRKSRRTTQTLTDQSWDTTVESAFRTRTLSPKSPKNVETYSLVDLVSMDGSNDTGRSTSVYNSAGSANTSAFGTPNASGRKTRSTIDPTMITSSTPYVTKSKAARKTKSLSTSPRSRSNPNISRVNSSSGKKSVSTRRSKSLTTPENTERHISVNSTRISRASKSRSRINDSDLLLLSLRDETEDDSPKSSRNISKSPSVLQNQSKRSTRKTFNITISPSNSPAQNETVNTSESKRSTRKTLSVKVSPSNNTGMNGTVTPETQHSPEPAGTPVLNIQSLLNSSLNSLSSQNSNNRVSVNLKRKTIGVPRSDPKKLRQSTKSKSFVEGINVVSRKSMRLRTNSSGNSDKTDDGALEPDNEEMVTPTSAVTLVQEAVKNKHSTAKKPQSKRSIIDNLNESDIVKQLFNSPVKRKLSQSMTEFSRNMQFDDEEDRPIRKHTRNTIALGRTPDNSLLENSENYTPERFVSPITTPNESPNLSGVKRIFRKSVVNDLSNVRGVKSLLRTPRARKSLKNDLTNVSGVKVVFAKSPRNRLSDVRVKELFAEPPKNDLTDVRGVKKLFQKKSPRNDLRNVSGVKRTFANRSPRNDLGDISGVNFLFTQNSRTDSVDDLLNQSHRDLSNSEALFNQLIGKPPIKAVYSKSFLSKMQKQKAKQSRNAKSMHDSINMENVEEWLRQELNKRQHKNVTLSATNTSKSRKSINKSANKSHNTSKVNKELQNLVTDTVEGLEPVRHSRIRNSSVNKTGSQISLIYSVHTLPIKKRSLVDNSAEKSVRSVSKVLNLPIKKRVVVHSTPVKGKYNMTMNASELGRVSPIVPVDKTRDVEADTSIRSMQKTKATPKAKATPKVKATPKAKPSPKVKATPKAKATLKAKASPKGVTSPKAVASPKVKRRRVTKVKNVSEVKDTVTEPSPRKTRKTKAAEKSVVAKVSRNTKSKNKTVTEVTNTKKRRSSLVITKKAPVLSPSPKATRRGKVQANAHKEQVNVTKVTPKKTRGQRQNTQELIDKPKTPKQTRARIQNGNVVVVKPSPVLKPQAAKTRGKKSDVIEVIEPPKRRGRKVTEPAEIEAKPARSRKNTEKTNASVEVQSNRKKAESPKPRRGRKTDQVEEPTKVEAKRGRKTVVTEDKPASKTRNTRGKVETQESVESQPRGRRGKLENNEEVSTTRKRKTKAEEVVPPKVKVTGVSKTKVDKTVAKANKSDASVAKLTRASRNAKTDAKTSKVDAKKTEASVPKTTRGRKTVEPTKVKSPIVENARSRRGAEKPEEPKTTRGKKVTAVEPEPKIDGRKRKTLPSPAKDAKKPSAKKARKDVSVVASPKVTRGRARVAPAEPKRRR